MSQNKKPRVALGMSGGVDSSLSAVLLKEAGYDVTGVYLECWRAPGCRTDEDRKDALAVALQLGLPFQVLDFKTAYHQKVVDYFFEEYEAGRTPNPDVVCNKEIKFGLFDEWASAQGFDFIATGHYAQIIGQSLVTSADAHKDQTYFLYRLKPSQLKHILFPIGHLTKPEVRNLAKKYNLPTAAKKDSTGICFIGEINIHEFLKSRLGEKPGDVVDRQGNVIGKHTGLWFYTIGQRHGFEIFPKTIIHQKDGTDIDKHNLPPFYVIDKDTAKNQLIVGFGREADQTHFTISDLNWLEPMTDERIAKLNDSHQLLVRLRHTGKLLPCHITSHNQNSIEIQLDTPIQGVAAGQSAVFYAPHQKLYTCLGGGVITSV